jgi:hypothetical protein
MIVFHMRMSERVSVSEKGRERANEGEKEKKERMKIDIDVCFSRHMDNCSPAYALQPLS